jgi:hypothetical protein
MQQLTDPSAVNRCAPRQDFTRSTNSTHAKLVRNAQRSRSQTPWPEARACLPLNGGRCD